jgi:hypothetical protein
MIMVGVLKERLDQGAANIGSQAYLLPFFSYGAPAWHLAA